MMTPAQQNAAATRVLLTPLFDAAKAIRPALEIEWLLDDPCCSFNGFYAATDLERLDIWYDDTDEDGAILMQVITADGDFVIDPTPVAMSALLHPLRAMRGWLSDLN